MTRETRRGVHSALVACLLIISVGGLVSWRAVGAEQPYGELRSLIVETAWAQIGKPYVSWGEGPDAFDCSGLVTYCWSEAGLYMPHVSGTSPSTTIPISDESVLPGDLVYLHYTVDKDDNGQFDDLFTHVGIYAGPPPGSDEEEEAIKLHRDLAKLNAIRASLLHEIAEIDLRRASTHLQRVKSAVALGFAGAAATGVVIAGAEGVAPLLGLAKLVLPASMWHSAQLVGAAVAAGKEYYDILKDLGSFVTGRFREALDLAQEEEVLRAYRDGLLQFITESLDPDIASLEERRLALIGEGMVIHATTAAKRDVAGGALAEGAELVTYSTFGEWKSRSNYAGARRDPVLERVESSDRICNSETCMGLERTLRVPSDYGTIQQAVDVACPRDTVLLEPGTYGSEVFIIGKRSVSIAGSGGASTTISAQDVVPAIYIHDSEDIAIADLGITGGTMGVRCVGSTVSIRDVHIANTTEAGVHCAATEIEIADSEILDVQPGEDELHGSGVVLESHSLGYIRNIKIERTRRSGIELYKSEAEIVDSEISGVRLSKTGSARGISLLVDSKATITGCQVAENASTGVQIYEGSEATILDCEIAANSRRGLHVSVNSEAAIRDTTIRGNGHYGISVWKSTVHVGSCTISETRVDEEGERGIGVYASTNSWIGVQSSVIELNENTGVYIYKSAAELLDNSVRDNGGRGIHLSTESEGWIARNDVASNARQGIILWESSGEIEANTVSNTTLSADGKWGVGIYVAKSKAHVEVNTSEENAGHGISIWESEAELIENKVEHNGACGIYVAEGSRATGYGNTLLGNLDGPLCGVTSRELAH